MNDFQREWMNEWVGFGGLIRWWNNIKTKNWLKKIRNKTLGKNRSKTIWKRAHNLFFVHFRRGVHIQVQFVQCQFFCFCLKCLLPAQEHYSSTVEKLSWIELDLKLDKRWLPLMTFIAELNTQWKISRIAKSPICIHLIVISCWLCTTLEFVKSKWFSSSSWFWAIENQNIVFSMKNS